MRIELNKKRRSGREGPSTDLPERTAAFLSYSHLDLEFANWLHHRLETYKVPPSLIGRPHRDGAIGPRIGKVLRDRTDFAAGNLEREVRASLEAAEQLIVVCSPNSAKSHYVNREIRYFKQIGKGDAILLAIISGEPHAASKPEYRPEDDCFPKSIVYQVGSAGDLTTSPEPTEPLAADFRPEKDGRENGFLKLVAGLLSVGLDELIMRERQSEKKRRQRAYQIAGTMACLAAAALVSAGFAWWARNLAASREQQAQQARGDAVAAQHLAEAQSHLAIGRNLAVTATALSKESSSSPTDVLPALVIEAINRIPPPEARALSATMAVRLGQMISWRSKSEEEAANVAFLPHAHVLAMVEFGTGLQITDIDRNQTRLIPSSQLGAHDGGAPNSTFAPVESGPYLVVETEDNYNYILDSRTLRVTRVPAATWTSLFAPDFSSLATLSHDPNNLNFFSLPAFHPTPVKLPDYAFNMLAHPAFGLAVLAHDRGFRLVKASGEIRDYDLPPGLALASITGDSTSLWIAIGKEKPGPFPPSIPASENLTYDDPLEDLPQKDKEAKSQPPPPPPQSSQPPSVADWIQPSRQIVTGVYRFDLSAGKARLFSGIFRPRLCLVDP
jgi:hypothetical protein